MRRSNEERRTRAALRAGGRRGRRMHREPMTTHSSGPAASEDCVNGWMSLSRMCPYGAGVRSRD
eukprot:6082036-Prymnesium_polylepis.2